VEGLVLVGGKFVLNVLGQGKSAAVSKQLLKPFKPGENRFGELPTKQTESGNTILADAVSHKCNALPSCHSVHTAKSHVK
jgi:flavin reductase (DIM6/NTAB) family NADH-FMN oxidoreductase RutF